MSIRTKLTLVMISGVIAVYALVGGLLSGSPFGRTIASAGPYPQLKIFEEVVRHIVNEYVEKPDLNKVRIGALRGLTDGLDPYSGYLLPQQVKEYQANSGRYQDMTGMTVGSVRGYGYVVSVLPNSPAAKAGIKTRDFIEYIEGHATPDIDLADISALLSGQPGTTVEVSIRRGGSRNSEKIKITRAAVVLPKPETQMLDQQVGYIKVNALQGQADSVQAAIKDVTKRGANKIILDLRGSAGDDFAAGVETANYFLKSGTIAKVIGRKERVIETVEAKPEKAITDLPLAVIVDTSTAGAAEVLAAAIQDNKRGDLIGERTFGIGSRQQLFPLEDGSALLLTTSRFASPNGKFFLPDGVTPGSEVKRKDLAEAIPEESEADPGNSPSQKKIEKTRLDPVAVTAEKPSEDLLLKKALETLLSTAKGKKK